MTHDHSLAARIDGRMVPIVGLLLLIVDVGVGITLVAVPDSEFESSIYMQAKSLWSLDAWGTALLFTAVICALAWLSQGRCRFVGTLHTLLLAPWFGFWTVLAALSSLGQNGTSGLMPILSFLPAALHIAVGMAWPRADHLHLLNKRGSG